MWRANPGSQSGGLSAIWVLLSLAKVQRIFVGGSSVCRFWATPIQCGCFSELISWLSDVIVNDHNDKVGRLCLPCSSHVMQCNMIALL